MKRFFAACICCIPLLALAHDLGVQGNVYKIQEEDLRKLFMQGTAQLDAKKIQDGLKNAANDYFKELPVYNLPTAQQDELDLVDLSVPYPQDVSVPVKDPQGKYKWVTLAKKGELVNPLKYVKLNEFLLVVDGNKPKDFSTAVAISKAYGFQIKVVVTRGNPAKLAKAADYPIFYFQPELQSRFQVKAQPALLYQSKDPVTNQYLSIQYFGPPFTEDKVKKILKSSAIPLDIEKAGYVK